MPAGGLRTPAVRGRCVARKRGIFESCSEAGAQAATFLVGAGVDKNGVAVPNAYNIYESQVKVISAVRNLGIPPLKMRPCSHSGHTGSGTYQHVLLTLLKLQRKAQMSSETVEESVFSLPSRRL
jgi:hypothetical protein